MRNTAVYLFLFNFHFLLTFFHVHTRPNSALF